jgi:lipopolysaccharide transport system ATP-binding protein
MATAIEVRGLSKRFEIGSDEAGYMLLTETISQRLRSFGRRPKPQEFWALQDIDFEVEQGQTYGIIGHNGAGKSTLLKILSRITPPTTGEARLRGRVGALLEVGTGFHPELTGRENVFLNGAILSMHRREIAAKFEEIVEFADIGPFIDTPVKRYSSGMQLRLAFSVAAHLEPEILIIDEVLSVGDLTFQEKCLGRMESASKEGRTVLFISHNLGAVRSLCDRALMLSRGRAIAEGPAPEVIETYISDVLGDTQRSLRERENRDGDGKLRFVELRLERDGRVIDSPVTGESFDFVLGYEVDPGSSPLGGRVGFGISILMQGEQMPLINLHSETTGQLFESLPDRGEVRCRVPRCPLPAGQYDLTLGVEHLGLAADVVSRAGEMTISGGDFYGSGREIPYQHRAVLIDHNWSIEEAASTPAATTVSG